MRGREPIVAERLRRVPPQFSWVDHRLIRDGHIAGHSAGALALYLFLIAVADADGLSWYSDAAMCRCLPLSVTELAAAREELRRGGLVAYRRPLYQVLDLAPAAAPSGGNAPRRGGEAASVGAILTHILQGGAQ